MNSGFYSAGGYAMPMPKWRIRMDFNGAAQDTQTRTQHQDDYDQGDNYEKHMAWECRMENFI
jgi:hypothetical protein